MMLIKAPKYESVLKNKNVITKNVIQKLPPFVLSFPTSADDEWKFEFWPLHFYLELYYDLYTQRNHFYEMNKSENIWNKPKEIQPFNPQFT